jgi:ATP-binding cassette subfamily B protein
MAADTAAGLAVPGAVGRCVGQVVRTGRDGLSGPLLALGLLLLAIVICTAVSGYALAAQQARATYLVRVAVGRRLAHGAAGRDGYVEVEAGDAATRVMLDAPQLPAAVGMYLVAGNGLVTALGGLVLLARIDWRLTVGQVCGAFVLMVILRRFVTDTSPLVEQMRTRQAEIGDRLLDARRGAASIRANGRWGEDLARILRPLPGLHEAGVRMWGAQALMAVRIGIFIPAMQVVALLVAALGLWSGRLTEGDLAAALGYTVLVLASLDSAESLAGMNAVRVGRQRIAEMLAPAAPASGGPAPGPEASGAADEPGWALRLDQVSLRRNDHDVLDGVSLRVPRGACLAVLVSDPDQVSLVASVLGGVLSPDSGQVQAPRAVLAAARPAYLGGTVAGLIGLGTAAPREQVRRAAALAHVLEVVDALPDGMNTPLDGLALSGGELQRLGLAQALARQPALLVLDDATNSLDQATEAEILAAAAVAAAGRTLVLVTHRPAAAALTGQVLTLRDGDLVPADPRCEEDPSAVPIGVRR